MTEPKKGKFALYKDGTRAWEPEDATWVEVERDLFDSLLDSALAVERVRELHKPSEMYPACCAQCLRMIVSHLQDSQHFAGYPCATIKALDGEQ